MRDKQTTKQTVEIELLSQWKLEAEFRKKIKKNTDSLKVFLQKVGIQVFS